MASPEIAAVTGILPVATTLFYTGSLLFFPLGLVIGYGFAWIGHFFVEKNKPASFNYPFWSFRSDWKMWVLMLSGRMQPEIERAVKPV